MNLKTTFCTVLSIATFSMLFSQMSFEERLKANGEEAVYQRYYSVYVDDDGVQKISNPQAQFTITPTYFKEIPSGFEVIATGDEVWDKGKVYAEMDVVNDRYETAKGYPNISYFYHDKEGKAWIALEDYVIEVKGITNDGLSYRNIETLYIKLNQNADDSTKKKGKKKKKGAMWKKLKEAAKASMSGDASGGSGPEYKKASETNLREVIEAYLKAMNDKQSSYTLSTAEKAAMAMLKNGKSENDARIKRYNDSVYATPEYQAILENNRRAEAAGKRNNTTLYNSSSTEIFVGTSGSSNPGTRIAPGGSASWSCNRDAYLQTVSKVSNTRSFKSTTTKVYTANSGCGKKMTVR